MTRPCRFFVEWFVHYSIIMMNFSIQITTITLCFAIKDFLMNGVETRLVI